MKKDQKPTDAPKVGYRIKKRGAFFKLGYNDKHIPHQGGYAKAKKKRLDQWDNPKFNWPPRVPRPTMHKGKALLMHLDSEQKQKIEKERPFSMPNYRTGDVIDLTYFLSLSEGKFNTFRGLIIGTEKRNNLREALFFHTMIDGYHVTMKKPLMSPMIAKVDIVKYGSNKLRKK